MNIGIKKLFENFTLRCRLLSHLYLFCLFMLINLLSTSVFANEQKELDAVRGQIASQQKSLSEQEAEQKKLKKLLSEQEKEVAKAEKALKEITAELKKSEADLKQFNANLSALNENIEKQKILLKQQIDLAFKQGQSSSMEMLFSSADSQKNDRIVGYLAYLNRQREETIATIKNQEAQVAEQKTLIEAQITRQQSLVNSQKEKSSALEKAKAEQAKTLANLNKEVKQSQNRLLILRDQEITLESRINQAIKAEARRKEEAEKLAQQQKPEPATSNTDKSVKTGGLGNPSKQFNWPVAGRVIVRFAEQLQGEIISKGLVVEAPRGSLVKSIAAGEVLIADELQGYGLVIVVDHGNGDMSLYGFNESVKVQPGQQIKEGQIIGSVGMAEGETYSALYFEIRREGSAVNPAGFLR